MTTAVLQEEESTPTLHRRRPWPSFGSLALLVFLAVVVVPPIFMLLFTAFRTNLPGRPGTTYSLDAWRTLFSPDGWQATGNSLAVSLLITIFAVSLGFFFAWLHVQTNAPGMKRLSLLIILPLVFSPLLTTISWTLLAARRSGFLNSAFTSVFGAPGPLDVYSIWGMAWVGGLYYVPLAYLGLRGAFKQIDASAVEAARASGAPLLSAIRRVLLPLLLPSVGAVAILIFTLSLGMVAIGVLLGSNARVNTLQLVAYYSMLDSPSNPPLVAAIAVLLLVVTALNLGVYSWLVRRPRRFATLTGGAFRPVRINLGRIRYAFTGIVILYTVVAAVVPYLALIYAALVPYISTKLTFNNLSFDHIQRFLEGAQTLRALRNTGWLAIGGSALTLCLGAWISYVVVRERTAVSKVINAISMVPLALPGLSIAIGLLAYVLSFSFTRDHLYGTLFLLYLAQMISLLPLAATIVRGSFMNIGAEVEEAARVFGASTAARLRRIILPLVAPTLASAWLILALESATEAGMSVFLYTGSSETVAISVFRGQFGGDRALVYAGAAFLSTLGLVAILVGQWLFGAGDVMADRDRSARQS